MTKKVLAYSLFDPKVLPRHRTHDRYKSDRERYWFNLPAVVLTNKILYPSHEMRLYLSPNVLEHPLAPVLEILSRQPNFSYQTVNMDYTGTEPAIWRMMPLWERDVDILHSRDIDSVPTEIEYRYTTAFENSDCSLGTLRTHANHYGIKCRMLAGLSSFRPPRIPTYMKYMDFYTYYAMRHGNYGSDQDLMIERFTTSPEYTKEYFYDHRAYRQKNSQDFPCQEATSEDLSCIKLSARQETLFTILREASLDNWAGQPVDARGAYTNHVISQFPAVKNEITKNKLLKEFYKAGEEGG
tara:strand:+ start:17728 stop:18618 length:891 start_codon:yes stop_codon:yes gene_type:complete